MTSTTRSGRLAEAERADPRIAAMVALALGAFMVFATGFAAPAVLHSATHDTRHAFAFPCH
jgi:cobalt transporter subunit CbtB